MISRLIGLMILMAVLVSPPAQAGDIYRWTDEQGVVNYGDSVPDRYKRIARKIDTGADIVATPGAASAAGENAQANSPAAPSSATGSGRPAGSQSGATGY
jgi:hypothetical protein